MKVLGTSFLVLYLLFASGLGVEILLSGIHDTIDGVEYVYQNPLESVKGLLFVAHGCKHSATDWWPVSDKCPKCIGLPVEKAIVRNALSRHIMVVAVSSSNRKHMCWMPHDKERVATVLKHVYKTVLAVDVSANPKGQEAVPLYLLGASSGGSFVGMLATDSSGLKVSSVCVQISSIYSQRLGTNTPPILFVEMSKDPITADDVKTAVSHLTKLGVQSKILSCSHKALTPDYFFSHESSLTKEDSAKMVAALHKAGYLTDIMHLKADPRHTAWREVCLQALPQVFPSKDSLVADESPISELMNLAWGHHEITDEYIKETFEWFDGSSGTSETAGKRASASSRRDLVAQDTHGSLEHKEQVVDSNKVNRRKKSERGRMSKHFPSPKND